MRTDLTGQVFWRLTVVSAAPNRGYMPYWKCICTCGNSCEVQEYHLGTRTNSCGCLRQESRHGLSHSVEYYLWANMKNRCLKPDNHRYADYGGRGITVCQRWRDSFVNFYRDMGPRPARGYTLDRINNDGNYEPGNVRWATPIEQASNTRANRFLTHQGLTLTIAEWARRKGISSSAISSRLKLGWSTENAIEKPTKCLIKGVKENG